MTLLLLVACGLTYTGGTPTDAADTVSSLDSARPTETDTDTAPGDTADSADSTAAPVTVTLVTGDSCPNPCTFSARYTGDVDRLRYEADGWELGTVDADEPSLTYTFTQTGDRDVRVVALDASGAELADDDTIVTVRAPEGPDDGLGVWLWYIEGVGMSHAALAERLASLGVKRIYVKVADGDADCDAWPELCDPSVPATYHAAGLEVWAWAYVYPGSTSAQSTGLTRAAQSGYDGYVLDIEVEFDGANSTLTAAAQAFDAARDAVVANGTVPAGWPLRDTTWGNPADHGMRVDILDTYMDAHMPQTYVEVWGDAYREDPARWVQAGTCEYRSLGATKPIHHVVSTEYGDMTPAQIDTFIQASGPETSIWRVPGGGTPTSIWDDWADVDWSPDTYDEPDCP